MSEKEHLSLNPIKAVTYFQIIFIRSKPKCTAEYRVANKSIHVLEKAAQQIIFV